MQYHGIKKQELNRSLYTSIEWHVSPMLQMPGLFIAGRMEVQISGERAVQKFRRCELVNTPRPTQTQFVTWYCGCAKLPSQWQRHLRDNPDRSFAQIEIDQLIQQIDLIAENANFNGVALLDGTMQNVGIQTGPTANERPSIFFKDNTSSGLKVDTVDVTTQANAKSAMVTLETALTSISDELSRTGAYENRFGHTISVLEQTAKTTKISRGRIMDADIAADSTKLSKAQVLSQANTAMLAQANRSMGQLLSLFN